MIHLSIIKLPITLNMRHLNYLYVQFRTISSKIFAFKIEAKNLKTKLPNNKHSAVLLEIHRFV